MNLKFTICLFLCFYQFISLAQDRSFIIKTIDSISKAPIPLVSIVVTDAKDSILTPPVYTSENGTASISISNSHFEKIVLRRIDYKIKNINIRNIVANQDDEIIVSLNPSYKNLQEFTITSTRSKLKIDIDRIEFNVEGDSNFFKKNAIDVIRNLPFIQTSPNGKINYKTNKKLLVLVNGKKFGIISNNPDATLKSFPANVIKSVQLISTVPTRYQNEGVDAILNIETVNGYFRGTVGNIEGNIDTRLGSGDNFYILSQHNNTTLQANFRFDTKQSPSTSKNSSIIKSPQPQNQDSKIHLENRNYNYSGELSFNQQFTHKWALNLYGTAYKNKERTDNNASYSFLDSSTADKDYLYRGRTDQLRHSYELGGELLKQFKKGGKELSVAFKYNQSRFQQMIEGKKIFTSSSHLLNNTENNRNNNELAGRLSYSMLFKNKLKIQSGISYYKRSYKSDVTVFDEKTVNEIAFTDNQLNKIVISSIYSYVKKSHKKYVLLYGLNIESASYINAAQQDTDTSIFTIKPLIDFKYAVSKLSTAYFKYQRSVKRPNETAISLSINSTDPQNLYRGNARLSQQNYHAFSLGIEKYTNSNKFSIFTEINYDFNPNVISNFTSFDTTLNSFITDKQELGSTNSWYFMLGGSLKLLKIVNIYLTNSLGYYSYSESSDNKTLFNSTYFNMTVSFKKSWRIQATAMLNTNSPTFQGYEASTRNYSISLNKNFANERGFINLTCFDFINSEWKNKQLISTSNLYQNNISYIPARLVGLTIGYRFGNLTTSPKPIRKVLSNDIKD